MTDVWFWSQLNVRDITNMFLYGDIKTPDNLVDSALIRPKVVKNTKDEFVFEDGTPLPVMTLDMESFMTTGPGRFAIGGQFEIVKYFFDPSKGSLPEGVYTKQEVADKLFFPKTGKDKDGKPAYRFSWVMEQHKIDDGKPDYAERGYIYDKQTFLLK